MGAVKTKGNDVATLRKLMNQAGREVEDDFQAGLAPQVRRVFQETTPQQWIALEDEAAILKQASLFLFPGDSRALRRLARELVRHSLHTAYKMFLKMTSRAFLVRQAARLWNFFYNQGKAEVLQYDGLRGILWVREFPEFDDDHREYFAGVLEALLDPGETGSVNVEPMPSQDAHAWKWMITYQSC